MSSEAYQIVTPSREIETVKIYATDKSYRQHIVFPDGPAIYRDRLDANHNGVQIEKAHLYLPDPMDVQVDSIVPLVGMGGVATVGDDYARTAIAMAQEGRMYVTHKPLRAISTRDQLITREHRERPFLYTAQVGQKVIMATLLHIYKDLNMKDAVEVDLTCHSYGGMTGSELAALSPEVRLVILQDVAGIIEGSLKAHVAGLPGMLKEGVDTYKYIRSAIDEVTPDLFDQHISHIRDNILLIIREIYALVCDPDLSTNIKIAKENGSKVGGILFGKSAFFPLETVLKHAGAKELFDEFTLIKDARHIEANVNPHGNARVQIELIKRLEMLL